MTSFLDENFTKRIKQKHEVAPSKYKCHKMLELTCHGQHLIASNEFS